MNYKTLEILSSLTIGENIIFVTSFAAQHGLSRNAVYEKFNQLVEDGYITYKKKPMYGGSKNQPKLCTEVIKIKDYKEIMPS